MLFGTTPEWKTFKHKVMMHWEYMLDCAACPEGVKRALKLSRRREGANGKTNLMVGKEGPGPSAVRLLSCGDRRSRRWAPSSVVRWYDAAQRELAALADRTPV